MQQSRYTASCGAECGAEHFDPRPFIVPVRFAVRIGIRAYPDAGNVIETHEHAGDFKDSFSSGFLTVLQKTSPATQQPMGLENRFDCHFSLQQKLIAMSRTPTLARILLRRLWRPHPLPTYGWSGLSFWASYRFCRPRQLKPKTQVTCKTRKRKPKKRSKSVTSSQQKTPREGVSPRVFPKTLSRF
jgi:hypothetical protein